MNKFVALLGALLGIAGTVIVFLLTSAQREQAAHSRDRLQLNDAIRALELQVAALSATNAAANQLAAMAQTRAAEFRALAETNAAALAALTNRPPSSNAFSLKPYQVRSFVGTQYVGMAWVIPSNRRRDPKTGLIGYDQIVSLPDQSRGTFTAYVTNVVERTVASEPQLVEQNNFYDQRSYDSTPYWMLRPTIAVPPVDTLPPVRPIAPIRPVQPIHPNIRGGIYRPPSERGDPGLFVPPGL
jgi:hypothetical protein